MVNNTITLADIPLPSTDNLERQVIFDAVNNQESIGEMAEIVSPKMFADDTRKGIWEKVVGMYQNGDTLDYTTIFSKVGQPFINEIVSKSLPVATVQASLQHATILRSAYLKRKTYFSALRLLQASADTKTPDDAVFAAIEQLSQESHEDEHSEAEVPMSVILDNISNEVQERYQLASTGRSVRVPTGFPQLDKLTYGGWGPGQLIILAARPSMGKTSVMLKLARAAAEANFPTCIFSIEMTTSELGQKVLYSTEKVKPEEVMSGNMNWGGFEEAVSRLHNLPIYINDHTKDVNEIIARINANARKGRCKIAFIDYLSLMDSGRDSRTPLYQALGYITTSLKVAAKRAGIPIVLLCQLNRDAARENRPPQLTDLRDSGSIEQDADVVMMLSPKTSVDNNKISDIDIWLRKNRQYRKDVLVTVRPNDTFSDFYEVASADKYEEPPYLQQRGENYENENF